MLRTINRTRRNYKNRRLVEWVNPSSFGASNLRLLSRIGGEENDKKTGLRQEKLAREGSDVAEHD